MKKIFVMLSSIIMVFYSSISWCESDKSKNEQHIINTSELYKCSSGQIVGVNNLVKGGPWGIIVAEDASTNKVSLVSGTKVTLDGTRMSWKESNSVYAIQFDEKNERVIQFSSSSIDGKINRQSCRYIEKRK